MKKTTFEMLIKIIKKYKSKGRMLDVGCATGFFLEVAQEEGFIPYGVEISSYSSNLSQAQFGKQNVFKGILEDCEFADNFFDIITMSDLLEHVREPNKTLQKAKQLLKDDGIMLIVTPDSKSLSHKIMGSKWTHYKLEHFYYFNQDSLKYLAEENGLSLDYFAQTKKAINFEYLYAQFQVYPYWLIAPILNAADKILPKKLKTNNFRITMGEITAILKKKQI